jgi:Ca-activated chloride channel family protein
VLFLIAIAAIAEQPKETATEETPGGELVISNDRGETPGVCPLQHTDVQADIAGYVGRTRVRQSFVNPTKEKIEAVYVFPLPDDAAVDAMTMIIGARRIRGQIKPREAARKTYEDAKAQGKVASLLDQERPNIFTQAVANIEPGAKIEIEIAFTQTLPYKDGVFEWAFPIVVGPRYMPGAPTGEKPGGKSGGGFAPDTTQVPDASKISPWIAPPGTRAGHDISLKVNLDTGMGLYDVKSVLHEINVQKTGRGQAVITLKDQATIPNKDFILRYRSAGEQIGDALLTTSDEKSRYFTLVLQPPQRVAPDAARPKEMVFVIDRSGSMGGFPIEKAKAAMKLCIEGMNPRDTFNLLSFAGGTGACFPQPMPNTAANRATALKYLQDLYGSGGTEMMTAIHAALDRPADPQRLRIVCFMTDGYIGNDAEIIEAVKKNAGTARVFSFGIGNSVNRYLLDGMAKAGRGEVEYVTLQDDGDAAAKRFHERIDSPVLTDISLDWGDLPVEDVFPKKIPDLFSVQPMMIFGRMKGDKAGTITLRGKTGAGDYERKIVFDPTESQNHEALASLWARAKVNHLLDGYEGANPAGQKELKEEITGLAVEHRLMTQFTSFVAVDETRVTAGGDAKTVQVPVEMPEGVPYEAHPQAILPQNGAVAGAMAAARPASKSARRETSRARLGSGPAGPRGASRLAARPGAPLISVQAPPDSARVVALLPGGVIKNLVWNALAGKWEARFDIPTYAAEGEYSITVIIVAAGGHRRQFAVRYRVDLTPPQGEGLVKMDGRSTLRLEMDAGPDTNRVAALLPWGERVELQPAANGRFATQAAVPAAFATKAQQLVVTYVLTDAAHNRTLVTVDLTP